MASISTYLGTAGALAGLANSTAGSALNQLSQGNVGQAVSLIQQGPGSLVASLGSSGGSDFGDAFAGINKRGDAVESWSWFAVMPDMISKDAASVAGLQPSISLPWYYVHSANMPTRQFGTDNINRNGHEVYFPTNYRVDSLTLGMFVDSASKASQYLKAWQGLVLSNANPKVVGNQGVWGYPSAYKKDIYLVLLSVDKKTLLNVKYINCWPVQNQAFNLTSTDSSALSLDVTFAVEDVDVTVNNDRGLLDTLTSSGINYATTAVSGALGSVLNTFL